MSVVCDNKSIGRTLRGMSHGNPEQLEEQREETRLIIEELLKMAAIRTRCTPSNTIFPQTTGNPGKSSS